MSDQIKDSPAGTEWMLQDSSVTDEELFQALFHRYYGPVYLLALTLTGIADKAISRTRVVLQAAVSKRHTYWGEHALAAWLCALTIVTCKGIHNNARLPRSERNVESTTLSGQEEAGFDLHLIWQLSGKEAVLFILRYAVQLPADEIAYVMHIRTDESNQSLNRLRKVIIPEAFYGGMDFSITGQVENTINGSTPDGVIKVIYHLNEEKLANCLECRQFAQALAREEAKLSRWTINFLQAVSTAAPLKPLNNSMAENRSKSIIQKLAIPSLKKLVMVMGLAAGIFLLIAWVGIGPSFGKGALPAKHIVSGFNSLPLEATNISGEPRTINLNNSGPAELGWIINYWGGNADPLDDLQPGKINHPVLPAELTSYVRDKTSLRAVLRMGGDVLILKRLVDAGYPVIIERGYENPGLTGWAGVYMVAAGYDDSDQGTVMLLMPFSNDIISNIYENYNSLDEDWSAFNNLYIVVYPPGREKAVMNILGQQADAQENLLQALQKSNKQIQQASSQRDLYFAWFNRGAALVDLNDYHQATDAFDQASAIYPRILPVQRPWRMLWYQAAPFRAYYATGRYEAIIKLANQTIDYGGEDSLEQSYYWRALAEDEIGDPEAALSDLYQVVHYNPYSAPGWLQLHQVKAQVKFH